MINELNITGDLACEFRAVAQQAAVDPDALLKRIVRQFMSRYKVLNPQGEERRAFLRMSVRIPAMVYLESCRGEVRYKSAIITDVSPSGVKLICTGRSQAISEPEENFPTGKFELIFSYTDESVPIRFWCEVRRIERVNSEIHVGSSIMRSSPEGVKAYQKLLDDLGLVDGVGHVLSETHDDKVE